MDCSCETPGLCPVLKKQMTPRTHAICAGTADGITPEYREECVAKWLAEAGSTAPPARRRGACVHLGDETGLRDCPSCKGTVRVKTFACVHPAHRETTLAECRCCADHVEARELDAAGLTATFDRVVLISLPRRADRLAECRSELQRAGWPFLAPEIFAAVDGSKVPCPPGWREGGGAWGCCQSHRQVLERAIQDDVQHLLILEDDICFHDGFAAEVERFLRAVPADADGLYLGGQHMRTPEPVNASVVRCLNTQRTHAYSVRGKWMRDLYAALCSPGVRVHIDWVMSGLLDRYRIYAPTEFLVGQRESQSDINGRRNRAKFWVAPRGQEPIILLHAPRDVVQELRGHRIHTGHQRSREDVDVGLVRLFGGNPAAWEAGLRTWCNELQWECVSEDRLLAVWHPAAELDLLRRCWPGPALEVRADTAAEVLTALAGWEPTAGFIEGKKGSE